jgi:hypothetical protein
MKLAFTARADTASIRRRIQAMKNTLLAASFLLLFTAIPVRADSGNTDLVIQVNGAFAAQGEAFSVSYKADLTSFTLVPGTLTYSSSGPLAPFSVYTGSDFPEGAFWQDASGYSIELLLFTTPGCNPGVTECQPEIGPGEVFPPGTDVNAFAHGIFSLIPPGQSLGENFFGDVQVSLDPIAAPEPTTWLMLSVGLIWALGRRRLGGIRASGGN